MYNIYYICIIYIIHYVCIINIYIYIHIMYYIYTHKEPQWFWALSNHIPRFFRFISVSMPSWKGQQLYPPCQLIFSRYSWISWYITLEFPIKLVIFGVGIFMHTQIHSSLFQWPDHNFSRLNHNFSLLLMVKSLSFTLHHVSLADEPPIESLLFQWYVTSYQYYEDYLVQP